MKAFLRSMMCGFAATLVLCWTGFSQAQQTTNGADLFPASTTAFLEIPQPDQLFDKILEHPIREKIEGLEPVRDFMKSPQFKQMKIGVGFISAQIGEDWLPALKTLTAGGIYVGFDAQQQAVAVAFRSEDEALLKKTAGVILGFAQQNRGDGNPINIENYRTGKVAEIDDVTIGRFGQWFLISNQSKMAQAMADRLLDQNPGLGQSKRYQRLRSGAENKSDAWAMVDVKTIREMQVAEDLFAGSTDDPNVELLFGGILEAFKTADVANLALSLTGEKISLTARLPFETNAINPAREFFFGAENTGRAPQPIEIPDLLGQVVSYRDIGEWWLSKEDLFPESVVAQLAQSDSELSTLFGGMDFGEEVLGALQPGMRIVAKRQTFDDANRPDIQLPAFALIARLEDPSVERRFRVSFQSMMAFININSGRMDYPQLEISTLKEDGFRLTAGEYLLDDESRSGLIIHNFSPALAFQDDYMIVSSTLDLARELAEATQGLSESNETSNSNTLISLEAKTIQQTLVSNRDALIAQMMVNQGKDRHQAGAEFDMAMGVLDYLKNGKLDFRVEPEQLALDLEIGFLAD